MADPEHSGFIRCSAPPALGADEIHLWHMPLALPAARALRAQARDGLLRLLRGYLAGAEPVLEVDAKGKPRLAGKVPLQFNLSHCPGHVMLAFAWAQPLGVDIEARGRRVSVLEVARRFFHADEAAALAELPAALQLDAFVALWTHKEALLKALGDGLSFGLDRIPFALEPSTLSWTLRAASDAADWRLHAFAPAPEVTGCLAWQGRSRRVRQLRVA
ncbi:MAG: 4'-phosphopantetheinyl transferase superfamily protein [Dokdonella sp.]|uniref:4'-phosphopantetheinyl transferase family protein n=1 Tax=Dokdonella sp. TaxID=2291710 RepID=UPI0025B98BF5|nr:4'-phosphopantetheinyl transferase superfamily protein [Dokdonella sp.]MBX3701889.1 4'-phosphopantetheinyl transferase superfamily protein [Dokdonella sp.]